MQFKVVIGEQVYAIALPDDLLRESTDFHRITSYNVCYTKLLRRRALLAEDLEDLLGLDRELRLAVAWALLGATRSVLPADFPRLQEVSLDGVITSYSIHYTKLYEELRGRSHVRAVRGEAVGDASGRGGIPTGVPARR